MSAAIGIDFGTTNSALARVGDSGAVEVSRYPLFGQPTATFRSILFFPEECEWVRGVPQAFVGPRAIEEYLEHDGEGRLMQSMKTFLASRLVRSTNVFGYDYPLEQLIARILDGLVAPLRAGAGSSAPLRTRRKTMRSRNF